jgi:HK97 gp10 family phage protein
MADGGIKVIGLDETIKALQEIGTPTRAIAAAGVESARIVAAEAKTLVPTRTGRLAASIKPSRTKHGSRIVAGGPGALYGLPVHWGWFRDRKTPRAVASPKGYIDRNIKPNPFLSRALGYTKQQVIDTYRKNMNKLIEQETAKARKGSK